MVDLKYYPNSSLRMLHGQLHVLLLTSYYICSLCVFVCDETNFLSLLFRCCLLNVCIYAHVCTCSMYVSKFLNVCKCVFSCEHLFIPLYVLL